MHRGTAVQRGLRLWMLMPVAGGDTGGCDDGGCDTGGCDDGGCDTGGCDGGGCDTGGCDMGGCDGGGCDEGGCDSGNCDAGGCNDGGCDAGGCDTGGCDKGGCDGGGCDTGGCDGGGCDTGGCDGGVGICSASVSDMAAMATTEATAVVTTATAMGAGDGGGGATSASGIEHAAAPRGESVRRVGDGLKALHVDGRGVTGAHAHAEELGVLGKATQCRRPNICWRFEVDPHRERCPARRVLVVRERDVGAKLGE